VLSSNAHAAKWVTPYNFTDLEWYTIETEHFAFHYPKSKEEEGNEHYLTAEYSARRFAEFAEENWYDMCAQFNYFLKERIHVLVLNHGDELEGFTIPSWDWIVMSANPGGGLFSYSRGRMEWFSTVFAHEFAHVVSLKAYRAHAEPTFLSAVGGLYNNGVNMPIGQNSNGDSVTSLNNSSIGLEIPIADSDSVWWVEGGAEFWSGATNVNWWTTARDRTIRVSLMEDRLLSYEEWHHKVTTGWNDGERWYQGGHSFALYLRERFGPDVMAQFALEYSKGWRPLFETVVEDVTGVDCETLYYDWLDYITVRYDQQYANVRAKGEVSGLELLSSRPAWEYKTPSGRDTWMGDKEGLFGDDSRHWFGRKTFREREQAKEATGLYQYDPRTSDDGDWIGVVNRGQIVVNRVSQQDNRTLSGAKGSKDSGRSGERSLQNFSIPYAAFDHGWDFLPSGDGIILTGHENSYPRGKFYAATNINLELDGYDWKQIAIYKFPELIEEQSGNVTYKTRKPSKGYFTKRMWHGEWEVIPNTKRGHDPAISPDGSKVAFLHYTDGTVNLATINVDGSDKKLLTNYSDGNWMRIVDWSPDGTQLVFAIFRNFQQNLYLVNADGSDLRPIMMDEWEEQDPHWATIDGKIYFSADPGGIDNVYSYDPANGKFLQITNVITGALSPHITKEGDLVYSHYTANGWKVYSLAKNEFLNNDATHLFTTDFTKEHVEGYLTQTLDYSKYDSMTRKYSPIKSMSSPVFIPIVRLQNQSRTSWGLQSGAQFQMMDYAQYNQVFAFFLLGEDTIVQAGYTNDMFFPSINVYGGHFQGKSDQGYLLDGDDNPLTTNDQDIYEIKRRIMQNFGGASMSYVWNGRFQTSLGATGFDYSLKGVDDVQFQRFMWNVASVVSASWSNNSWLSRSPNPHYGRNIELTWRHGFTDIVYEDMGSVAVDDGEEMDKYHFNELEIRWSEIVPIPSFGSKILAEAQKRRHVLHLDTQFGMIDRNVSGNDEFRAGGRHPYNFGYGSIQPNSQFAGYPSWSLGGETMMIVNAAYRFPITRPEQKWMYGPFYLTGLYGQISSTAGNLWSFRPPSDPSEFYRTRYDERVAYNPSDVRREIPFVDTAYKNGNHMLYDLSAEVRMTSVLYHTMSWDSFIRVAYGFNEIRGWGDVDGDDIFDTNDSALGDELSNETEPAGIRLYLGLGTGW
jgi:Tol biopolymer transport system component